MPGLLAHTLYLQARRSQLAEIDHISRDQRVFQYDRPEEELGKNLAPVTENGQSLIRRSKPIEEISIKAAVDLDDEY